MTTEVIAQPLLAGVQATFGQGRVLYIKTATAPMNIIAETQGTGATVRKFLNVSAGFKVTLPKGELWNYLRVTSATAQSVELLIGDDDVDIANAVTVTGGVFTQEVPCTVITTGATKNVANTSATTIAANAARRRLTLCNVSTNLGSVFIQAVGAGAGIGYELQPGTSVEIANTSALDIRNDSGAAVLVSTFEES